MSPEGFLPGRLQGFYGWSIFMRLWIYFSGSIHSHRRYQISRNWQLMDIGDCIGMEKLCQCIGRRVGMLIGPRALKTLNSIERIKPRMMTATFNGNPKATIISCCSPTNVSEETELVTFYEELSSLVRSIPKHNLLVIGGDMNAQIGKNRNNKYSLYNTSNRNGQHLIDFMIENRLTCLNTNFQKRRENYGHTHTRTRVKHR